MKKITGLDSTIKWIDGKEIKNLNGKPIHIKDYILGAVYSSKCKQPADAIRKTTKILPMLLAAKNTLEVEDTDYELVKNAVNENPEQRPTGIWGAMLQVFEENNDSGNAKEKK